ncbi:MAG TPA: GAF domain-containing protein [Patescibacteria group bacterium]|nr:GAF domain-containing protein [Patescibacteria group bacterium]
MSKQEKRIILLVDDEEPVAMAQEQALMRLGYECVVAHSGEAAVQLAASNPEIALILMDTDLGQGIDGREAARRILAARNLPIVFLASHPERRMPISTPDLPIFRYVLKNSGDVELQTSIKTAFELFASHEEAQKSEELQQMILATVPIAIYASPLDPEIDTSWVSGDIKKVTGFTADQYLAEKDFWRNRLHADDRERVLNLYKDPAAGSEIVLEYRWLCKDGYYKWFYDRAIKKHTPRGDEYFGIILDITERKRAENIIRTRLQLVEFAVGHSLAELLQKTLDEVCALTDSPIGFYHFVDPDQVTLTLQGWSTRTLQEFCTATPKGAHYNIEEAGVWVDCIRQRRPVIHNDYAALPHRKGLPEGHAQVKRELVVPILREQKIVAVLGIGNKEQDYTEKDIEFVAYFADVAWEITKRKQVEETLEKERQQLQKALDEVKTLRGIIPICANCKQIRDDKGYWSQVESYISDHTDAEFSHGICPECMKKLYSLSARKKRKDET